MAKKPFFDFLNGYESPEGDARVRVTGKRFFLRSFSGSLSGGRGVGALVRILGSGDRIARAVSYTTAKAYGAALLAFGLVTLALHFINDYLGAFVDASVLPLIVGALLSLVSVPLLLMDRPVSNILQENPITDYLIFEFFCIKRMHKVDGEEGGSAAILATLGALFGFIGYFVPIEYILLAFAALIFIYLSFVSPEFTFFVSILVLPYLSYIPYSDTIFAAIVVIATFSLFRKIVCGRRAYFFEQYDFLLGMLLICVLMSGIFLSGIESFNDSLYMIAMALGYILASNLVINRRLADCAMNALVISSLPAACVSVYGFVVAALKSGIGIIIDADVSSTFPTVQAYAVFLVVAIITSGTLAKQSSGALRVLYSALLVLNVAALVFTGETLALLAVAIASIFFIFKRGRLAAPAMLIFFLLPYAILLLPDDIAALVFRYVGDGTPYGEMLELWRASIDILEGNLWIGIGMGSESFAARISEYFIEGHTSSSNIFLELGIEAGVFALAALLLSLAVRLRHRARYARYIRASQVSTLSPALGAAFFGLIFYGSLNYIWADMPSFYLFWLVFGMGSASLRIAKKESDDRILYYEDARRSDYSAIDVEIR